MFLFFLQYMGELGCEFEVYRNDELTVDELKAYGFFFSLHFLFNVYFQPSTSFLFIILRKSNYSV